MPAPSPSNLSVYVHFPWCVTKCPYCDFVSFASESNADRDRCYAVAVQAELLARSNQLRGRGISPVWQSIFFGGGTPSLWDPSHLGMVLTALRKDASTNHLEITVECNPSSLDADRIRALRDAGVNRLSIGVQSLHSDRLRFLGRRHSAEQALHVVREAVASGIPQISCDLLFGVATQSAAEATEEVCRLADLGIGHISAYNLTIEPKTLFGQLAQRRRLPIAKQTTMIDSFFSIHQALTSRGFSHYEVSNYALAGQSCIHNLAYWQGDAYLGLGCAAYGTIPTETGSIRYRNNPDPSKYMKSLEAGAPPENELISKSSLVTDVEPLCAETLLRERIMLGLRLTEGVNLAQAAHSLHVQPWPTERQKAAERLIQRGRLVREGDRLRVPLDAWIFADGTAAELF